MAFDFLKWLFGKPEEDEAQARRVNIKDFLGFDIETAASGLDVYLRKMAFWTIVRKIGSAVAAVEWETYRRGKKVKAREYWDWNYSPNPNQNREEFFQRLISQLFEHQEALIVELPGGHRYVADSFTTRERLYGNIYSDISVNNESIPGAFRTESVIHLTIDGERTKRVLDAIASAEGQLLKSTAASYIRGQGMRGILEVDDLAEADPDFDEIYDDLIKEKFKKYYTAENAVLPLFKGYKYTEQEAAGKTTKSNVTGTRDIRNMIDDIVELTAQAMGVPVSIVTGKNVTDSDFKVFMTFTVQPIVKMIADEINRKMFGRDLVYSGTYIVANYAGVRYIDLFDVANPIDKLIGSGAFCVNDIRIRLGMDIIDEPWAWQHWMTKNYSSVEDLLEGLGEDTGTEPAGPAEPGKEGAE